MTARSLRSRLQWLAFAAVAVALIVTALLLSALFERHINRRVTGELDAHLARIAGKLTVDLAGDIEMNAELTDPRFETVFSGLYWQVANEKTGSLLRSKSLWDDDLALPVDRPAIGDIHTHELAGPVGQPLLVRERRILLGDGEGAIPVRIAVAIDVADVQALHADFTWDIMAVLAALGALLFVALWLQVRLGLGPLDRVRAGVAAIREGRSSKLPPDLPQEIAPLAEEIDFLIAEQQKEIERAGNRAGDLAHGLKTPLTILTGDVRRLREKGETAIAADIEAVSQIMRRHVERQLALARSRHGAGERMRTDIAPAVERLVNTFARLPDKEHLAFEIDVAPGSTIAMNPDDFNDVMGNLIENATRHASAAIRVETRVLGDETLILVADDGPGVAAPQLQRILQRGVRLDEKSDGAGLGLAIAGDILEAYRVALRARQSAMGGLEIGFPLPAPQQRRATLESNR